MEQAEKSLVDQPNEYKADVIEVTVSGGFKTEHVFNAADGILGVLKMSAGKHKGSFLGAEGGELSFSRINFWKSQYLLEERGVEIGTAKPPGALKRAFNLEYNGEQQALIPGKAITRTWRLLDRKGELVCELKPRGSFKRGALIRVVSPVDLKLLVFVYCLVSIRWQEQSSA